MADKKDGKPKGKPPFNVDFSPFQPDKKEPPKSPLFGNPVHPPKTEKFPSSTAKKPENKGKAFLKKLWTERPRPAEKDMPEWLLDSDYFQSFRAAFLWIGMVKKVPVRDTPKNTKIISQTDTEITVTFKAAIKNWWPLPVVLIWPVFWLVSGLGYYFGRIGITLKNPDLHVWPFWLLFTAGVLFLLWVWHKVTPTVTVRATTDKIYIGDYVFDRKNIEGLRIGYENTYDRDPKKRNAFTESQIFFTGLRMQHGRWGEDLPYMVNKYHAAEYVVWLNEMIHSIGQPEPKKSDPTQGRKIEIF